MSETGSNAAGTGEELDDPGRDPAGLDPPRNPLSGGASTPSGGPDQDSGQGDPEDGPGIAGRSATPELPQQSEQEPEDTRS